MRTKRIPAICLVWMLTLLGAAWAVQHPAPQPLKKREGNEQQRAAWFFRGRQSPDRQPAAAHLFQGRRQASRMQVALPRPSRTATGSSPITSNWTELGPRPEVVPPGYYNYGMVSGRVTALAVDLEGDPTGNTLYVGTANGGVWKSTDALSAKPTFTALTDGAPSLAVGSIAVDSSTQPATIYVGTGEGNNAEDTYYGVGILRSTDGGQTWQTISSADNGKESFFGITIDRILIDPANHQHLLAATGKSYLNQGGPYPNTGIYQSTDGGQSWTRAAQFTDAMGTPQAVTDLVYDGSAKRYYAAVSGMGIYSSTDGVSWQQLASPILGSDGLNAFTFVRASLAVRDGVVYVLYCDVSGDIPQFSASDTGLVESTDQGQSWTAIAAPDPGLFNAGAGAQGSYDQYIVAPANSTELVVGGIDVWGAQTVDGMMTQWSNLTQGYAGGPVHADQHAIAFVNPTTAFVGNDGGVWSTSDSGADWTDDNETLGTIQFYSATANSGIPGLIIAGAQDNGTSAPNLDGTPTWTESLLGDGGFTDVDPSDPSRAYGEEYGISLARSDDGGKTFDSYVVDGNVITDLSGFFTPYEVVPSRPWLLAMGTDRVWLGPGSTNYDGQDWNPISPVLTNGYITGVAVAPGDANVIYTVASDGTIQGTTNALTSAPVWNDLTMAPLPADNARPFSSVAVSPADANTVYVTVMGFGTGHVFKSMDGGASWVDISGNLPDAPANSIVIDPENPGDIYVATDVGVFVASDGGVTGESWQQMGAGLPETPVMQVKLSNVGTRMLIAATHGRGTWAIAPLTNNPDFALQLSPDFAGTISGQPTVLTATVAAVNGYSGTVALSCQAPSSGCSIQPASVQPGQPATVTLNADVFPTGSGSVTVSASDGTMTHLQNAEVEPEGILFSSDAMEMEAGDAGASVYLASQRSAQITGLICQNLPPGVSCQFANPDIDTANQVDPLTVVADTTAAAGVSTIQIAGTVGGQTITAPLTVTVHRFDLSAAVAKATPPNNTTPVTFTLQSGSLSGSVIPIALACDPASGVTCSFSPATITPGQSSTLTVTNYTQNGAQSTIVKVTGTAGSDQQSLKLEIDQAQADTLDVSTLDSPADVTPGTDTATFFLIDRGTHASNETVNYSCTATGGPTCTVQPNPVLPNFENVTVSGLNSLPAGTLSYSLQAQATLNSLQQTVPLKVQWDAFALQGNPVMQVVMGGTDSVTMGLGTTGSSGYTTPISLTCSAPSGINCVVTPASVTPGQSATVQLTGLSSLTPQNVSVDVTGTVGPTQQDLTYLVKLSDFALTAPVTTPTLPAGADTATFNIHAIGQNRVGTPIQLGCKTTAAVTCSFSPANMVEGASSTLTISGLNAAAAQGDTVNVDVTGVAGSDTHTLPLTLKLQDFAGAPPSGGATSETILAGQTAKYTLTYSSVNGFSGPVTLACNGGPVPGTCTVSPAAFSLASGGSQTVTVSVSTVTGSLLAPVGGGNSRPWGELLAALGLLGLLGLAVTGRRRMVLAGGLLLLGALLLAGCGGGSGGSGAPRTPAGTTTVTVTATSGGVSRTTKLGLTVQ